MDELRFFLPDNLIVGALDLVEHDSGTHFASR